jgi:hypothetical protein
MTVPPDARIIARTPTRLALGLGLLAVTIVGACSSSTAPATKYPMKLSVSTTTRAAAGALASMSSASAMPFGGGSSYALTFGTAGELVITKAQIVLDQIELSPTEGNSCNGTGSNNCEELDHDAMIVDLPTGTGLNTVVQLPVAAGTYSAIEAEIQASEKSILGHPEFDGRSVRVEGTYKGVPFVFTSNVKASFEMSLKPPVVVTTTSKNITVNVDLSKWFLTAGGAAIDPATALTGGVNEALVKANIKASFSSFGDDNEKGGK